VIIIAISFAAASVQNVFARKLGSCLRWHCANAVLLCCIYCTLYVW